MKELLNKITTGDARELTKLIPDESIDLIFTDPVYDRIEDYEWLAKESVRILKPHGWLIAFQYVKFLPETFFAMNEWLEYEWLIIWHRNNEMKFRYSPTGKSTFVPAVVYSKGNGKRKGWGFDLLSLPIFSDTSNHQWSKPKDFIAYYIEVFSDSSSLVLDPFVGGGTVPAMCKILGRDFIAFEIDPKTARLARERVLNTQPPLFVLEPEQLELKG